MKWAMFTKRTDDPKLAYLEGLLDGAGIPHRRNGHSYHAPILEVKEEDLDRAWEILTPIDDISDDDPRWTSTDLDRLIDYLVATYLEKETDLTVAEITAGIGWPESKVRRVLCGKHGGVTSDCLSMRKESRPSYSKSYRGMESGAHNVWVYGPSRHGLAEALKKKEDD